MYCYRVYGLNINANLCIDVFNTRVEGDADVNLYFVSQNLQFPSPPNIVNWGVSSKKNAPYGLSLWSYETSEGSYHRFLYTTDSDSIEFVFDLGAGNIWVSWTSGIALYSVQAIVAGPIIGAVLRIRGKTCLHSSVIDIDGRAIVLIGYSGAGKSTTAATLSNRGYSILADDVAVLTEKKGSQFYVESGYPRLRLDPSVLEKLEQDPTNLAPVTAYNQKKYLELSAALTHKQSVPSYQFQNSALPLKAIFVLSPRDKNLVEPFIEPLSPTQAVLSLVGNTYVDYIIDAEQRKEELVRFTRLVSMVKVYAVKRPDNLAKLESMCSLIVNLSLKKAPKKRL